MEKGQQVWVVLLRYDYAARWGENPIRGIYLSEEEAEKACENDREYPSRDLHTSEQYIK